MPVVEVLGSSTIAQLGVALVAASKSEHLERRELQMLNGVVWSGFFV